MRVYKIKICVTLRFAEIGHSIEERTIITHLDFTRDTEHAFLMGRTLPNPNIVDSQINYVAS